MVGDHAGTPQLEDAEVLVEPRIDGLLASHRVEQPRPAADQGTVYLSRMLERHEGWILDADDSFVAYVNRYRRPRMPALVFVRWLDYDWNLATVETSAGGTTIELR